MMMTYNKTELAEQGLDLLAHAFELCQAIQTKGYGPGLAQSVVQIIFRDLPNACADEPDTTAQESINRARILIDSILRQPAQDICHSLSASVSNTFNLSHGKVNAIILPAMLSHLAKSCSQMPVADHAHLACIQCFAKLARSIDLPVTDEEDALAKLVLAVRKLRAQVGLPRSISECMVDEEAYQHAVPQMAKRAWLVIGMNSGRPKPSVCELEQILRAAF